MSFSMQRSLIAGSLLSLALTAPVTFANGTHFDDGPVVNVSFIRTVDGHFDDYMQWLATSWKKQEEAAKKAGLILSYRVMVAEPHNATDADIILMIEYKNWAALDGLGSKLDNISSQVEGSVAQANQSEAGRAKIRTVLGSDTVQEALLK